MPRPLRVEYKGARYHIMCRGNRGSTVFGSDDDARLFLKTLGETVQRTDFRVHAYVLMSTHYHLLIETPAGNLVDGMKWLQGAFTQRMNAMHQTWGHLFQGRYKAKVIDPSQPEYFRKVSEYIHLNPAAAGLLEPENQHRLESYPWSSYPYYLKPPSQRPEWLTAEWVLGHYSMKDTVHGRRRYAEMMQSWARNTLEEGDDFYESEEYRGMERGWIHGTKEFRKKMVKRLESGHKSHVPLSYDREQKRDLTEQAVQKVIRKGCAHLNIRRKDLPKLKKGDRNKVLLAAYIKTHYSLSNPQISSLLHMGHPTLISRCRLMVERDRTLKRMYRDLEKTIHEK